MSQPAQSVDRFSSCGAWLRRLLEFVYPRNCQICSAALAEDEAGIVCGACLARVRWIEPPFCSRCALPFAGELAGPFVCGYCKDLRFYFTRAICACVAEGVVRDCIHRFKYNRQLYFGPLLAAWLVAAARRFLDWRTLDAIVPVPLFPRKRRHRGFNQAEVLAVALARELRVPVARRCVRRVKETATQTLLDAEARARNLRGAFAVRNAAPIRGKRLVLVDDVFTTGATLNECARMLRRAGAAEVIALAVARGN